MQGSPQGCQIILAKNTEKNLGDFLHLFLKYKNSEIKKLLSNTSRSSHLFNQTYQTNNLKLENFIFKGKILLFNS